MIEDWKLAQKLCRIARTTTTVVPPGPDNIHSARWQGPAPGRLKCNLDASFSSIDNKAGIDMFIHDVEGCFVLAKIIWFFALCSVDVGEALGLSQAL
jgi:hypothetical protein